MIIGISPYVSLIFLSILRRPQGTIWNVQQIEKRDLKGFKIYLEPSGSTVSPTGMRPHNSLRIAIHTNGIQIWIAAVIHHGCRVIIEPEEVESTPYQVDFIFGKRGQSRVRISLLGASVCHLTFHQFWKISSAEYWICENSNLQIQNDIKLKESATVTVKLRVFLEIHKQMTSLNN